MSLRDTPMVAYGIDDVPLGTVRAVRSCCFEIVQPTGMACVTANAVYNVNGPRITLVCMAASVGSYACAIHSRPMQRA
jgi:hypothetical protein